MTRAFFFRTAALAVALALPAAPAEADEPAPPAQEPDAVTKAQAETLFREGTEALDAGDLAVACPKLEAAVALTQGRALGGKLVLARCYERAGKVASAVGLYAEVAARAEAAGQRERAAEAREGHDRLASEVPKLALDLSEETTQLADLEIRVGGVAQPRVAWASLIPVDPGSLEIEVRARGKTPSVQRVTIPAGHGTTRVAIALAKGAGGESAFAALRISRFEEAVEPPRAAGPTSFWSPQRWAGLSLGLVGIAGAGAGFALGGVAKSSYDDGLVTGGCSGSPPACDDPTPLDEARTLGDVATGLVFGGLGVLATGAIVFATAPAGLEVALAPGQVALRGVLP